MNHYYNVLLHTDLVVPAVAEVPCSYQGFAYFVSAVSFPHEKSALKCIKKSPTEYSEKGFVDDQVCPQRLLSIEGIFLTVSTSIAMQREQQ